MLRRLVLVLMLLAGLAVAPLARASQACCLQGCDAAMPACVDACTVCAAATALPQAERPVGPAPATAAAPAGRSDTFDDWIDEIWHPPD